MERGRRQSFTHVGYVVHCYVWSDGLGGTVTTDEEYPPSIAFVLMELLLEEFTAVQGDSWHTVTAPDSILFPPIEDYLYKYQYPATAEKVTKPQKDASMGQGLIFFPECVSTFINCIYHLPGIFANASCPFNSQILKLLCLGVVVFCSSSFLVFIGWIHGHIWTTNAYAPILGSKGGLFSYFNTTQDLSASLPPDFLALCPKFSCMFTSLGAQCHCDAADAFISLDGDISTYPEPNEQPSDDFPFQAHQG